MQELPGSESSLALDLPCEAGEHLACVDQIDAATGLQRRFGYRRLEETELLVYAREALDSLPFRDWFIWYAKDVEGLPDDEVADHLGLTAGSVSSYYSRAMKRLRAEIAA